MSEGVLCSRCARPLAEGADCSLVATPPARGRLACPGIGVTITEYQAIVLIRGFVDDGKRQRLARAVGMCWRCGVLTDATCYCDADE